VGPGFLFCAFKGASADGRSFIPQAEAAGCGATICSPPDPGGARPRILVTAESLRGAASEASRLVYGEPDAGLFMVGITGTNGKTTVCHLVESLLAEAGQAPGLIGTVGMRLPGGEEREAPNTTPEGPLLWKTLRDMADDGGKSAVMEVSSHALSLGRLGGLSFGAALFTNLSRDHLDFHADMEAYFKAKSLLFLGRGGSLEAGPGPGAPKMSLANADDPWGRRILAVPNLNAVGFGFKQGSVRGEVMKSGRGGVTLKVSSHRRDMTVRSRLLGRFNAENLLAAAAFGLAMGYGSDLIVRALSRSPGAPGRLSPVGTDERYLALVDYAHAPGALEAAVSAARDLNPSRVIVLFGCGGDRDKGKRPMMGAAAAKGDLVVLTSDNPRTEDQLAIIADAEKGVVEYGLARGDPSKAPNSKRTVSGVYYVEPDRAKAIWLGVSLMRDGDILLVAGKGHENYQITGREKRPFDDREETLKALRGAGKSE
jgi:UDP-N-acetylmuramoyl-L-alanyl-D-glutamate--2,6-diaminopimelate ligase